MDNGVLTAFCCDLSATRFRSFSSPRRPMGHLFSGPEVKTIGLWVGARSQMCLKPLPCPWHIDPQAPGKPVSGVSPAARLQTQASSPVHPLFLGVSYSALPPVLPSDVTTGHAIPNQNLCSVPYSRSVRSSDTQL